ncbi:MAG: DHHA1 domain-containing protein, partial [Gemmataceae bacterium]
RIVVQAREIAEADGTATAAAMVLSSPDWHPGVIGIVAGRLVERFARPVFLIAEKAADAPSPGSGRSIHGFPLHEVLHTCTGHLVSHGGHAMAAGLKVRPSQIPAFREAFLAEAARRFPNGPPLPSLLLDAEVPLAALSRGLLKELDRLEPFGAGNRAPRFFAAGLQLYGSPRIIGKTATHLSFQVQQGQTVMRAVAFGMADRLPELEANPSQIALAFAPKINEFRGQSNVELEVVDIAVGPPPLVS